MKVEIKIVAEIGIDKEEYPDITPQMVFDGLRLYESEVCDGFELTTTVYGCDNTADFFLKDAVIAEKRLLEQYGAARMNYDKDHHPTLVGHSVKGNKRLRSVEDTAKFICTHGRYGDVTVTYDDGRPFLSTCGIYLKSIVDRNYREELLKVLTPMQVQMETAAKDETDEQIKENTETEMKEMNQYEHWRRMAEKNKKLYPPGTRIQLDHMEDPYSPVPDGMKGTVKFVDDSGQIHMQWDNGRTLALNSDEDSFSVLSTEEQDEEQDEDEAPTMSM